MTENEFHAWLLANTHNYRSLTEVAKGIISNIISINKIDILSISGRTKEIDSCIEKIKRKGYNDPAKQMTDISGIRVITFFEKDISEVSKIIRSTFSIDIENSLDKDSILSKDQMGYRSIHYICQLGSDRDRLPEFQHLRSLKFEVQIRSTLQHAWAELAHDGNYKLSAKLPAHLERRLFVLAGALELIDSGLDDLSSKIDDYKNQLKQMEEAEFLGEEINSESFIQFMQKWADKNSVELIQADNIQLQEAAIEELSEFGIEHIKDINSIIPNNFHAYLEVAMTPLAVVRNWMIIKDPKKFVRLFKNKVRIRQSGLDRLQHFLSSDEIDAIKRSLKVAS